MSAVRAVRGQEHMLAKHIEQKLYTMSLEEKVGQLIMAHFQGEVANEAARTLIQDIHVGSMILYNFSNGLHSPEQVRALTNGLQEMNKHRDLPLLIAADQEGGIVTRLNAGFTVFPGNGALGMTEKPKLAERCALAMGEEMRAVGVNWVLGPVVDINTPGNPVIGVRAYSGTTSKVVEFGRHALQGYEKAGVLTCLKHFPGHGDTRTDSHTSLPVVDKTKEELETVELVPFTELAQETDAMMTAHVMMPALDPTCCATLSAPILQEFLRKKIGFKGVVISDSLVMEGVLKCCDGDIEEAAIRAFNAGCNMLILGGKCLIGSSSTEIELTVQDVKRVHGALCSAVKAGRITQGCLDEALGRIFALKQCVSRAISIDKPLSTSIATPEHLSLAEKIARKALRASDHKPCTIVGKNIALVAPALLQSLLSKIKFPPGDQISLHFKQLNPSEEEKQMIDKAAISHDSILFFSYNAWKNSGQQQLIELLCSRHPSVTVVVTRDPLDKNCIPDTAYVLTTYSPTAPSLQAAVDVLSRKYEG